MHSTNNTRGRRTLTIRVGTLVAAALAVLASFVLTGCSTNLGAIPEPLGKAVATGHDNFASAAAGVTIAGAIVIEGGTDNWTSSDGSTCSGTNGFSDLSEGGAVTVTSGNGDIIGQGFLDAGVIGTNGCILGYTITDLPVGEKLYLVEVTHRGKIAATKADDHSYLSMVTIGGN